MAIFHGGGWCLGGFDTEEFQYRLWCQRLGVVVGNVAYRLAPEYKFPVLPCDAYDSVRCVGSLGIGAEDVTDDCVGCKECCKFWLQTWRKASLLVDFSGGATFAAMASHLARDGELEPSITGVFLCAPPFSDQVNDGTGKMDLVRMRR